MKKYAVYLWILLFIGFVSFIGLMSYWYPVSLDEYFRWGQTSLNWEVIKVSYLEIVPRISSYIYSPIFVFGKWFFIFLNCIIQTANCLMLFYILFLRLPDIKDLKDMPYFIMILCMSIFFVCSPSEVLFWVSGTFNYSWSIIFFLFSLCLIRQMQAQKFIFEDNFFTKTGLFILGFIVCMSNECLIPVSLLFTICFAIFCDYKKIKTPRALSFMIFGMALGCLVFFASPAHYNKMGLEMAADVTAIPLSRRLFFHIFHLNEFLKTQFFLPLLTGLFLIVIALDKIKRNFKDADFWYSLLFLFMAFLMAFILVFAPTAPVRAYYPSSILCILAFLFMVKHYISVYGVNFSKYLCYLILLICLILTPRYVIPHYVLHKQELMRNHLISVKKTDKNIPPYIILAGPTENLTINFTDPARRVHLGNELYMVDASPVINW